jgi:uncharacterized protein (UPF0297 family)
MVGVKVFHILLRGGDPTVIMRSEAARRLVRKFDRMKTSVLDGKQGK